MRKASLKAAIPVKRNNSLTSGREVSKRADGGERLASSRPRYAEYTQSSESVISMDEQITAKIR